MYGNCPNCGYYSGCGCSHDERLQAMRIKERERRRYLREIGEPVLVDHLGGARKPLGKPKRC